MHPKRKIVMKLTQKGSNAVAKVKSKYEHLKGQYGRNTFDRLVFEFPHIPACVIIFAISNPSHDDLDGMVKNGYATR